MATSGLRVVLEAIEALLPVLDGGDCALHAARDDLEPLGQPDDLVAVAHPHGLPLPGLAVERGGGRGDVHLHVAVLLAHAGLDGAAEGLDEELHPVADAEDVRAGGGGEPEEAGDSLSASVSSLAAALNPRAAASASSGRRALPHVLRPTGGNPPSPPPNLLALPASLAWCAFALLQVDRARLDCLVRTAVSALSDSASCGVARTDDRAEMLCIGSSVSPRGPPRAAAGHSYDLLHVAVKTALLSPRYQCLFPSPYYREDGENSFEMGTISLDVTTRPSYQVIPRDGSVPPRLTIMNFPIWFSFATALLFHQEGSQGYLPEVLSKEKTAESISDISLAQRAAFYLSWVLCPSNVDECQVLANSMVGLSHSWARNNKRRPSYAYHTSTVNHRSRLRVPTVGDTEKLHVSTNSVSSLIKDFDDRCVKFCRISAVSQVEGAEHLDVPLSCPNFLHLRVPLGVLLVSSACISEQDCNVLLHYTSTGLVLESKEVQTKRKDQAGNDVSQTLAMSSLSNLIFDAPWLRSRSPRLA
ncbi:hypothetical protein D1007_55786 [Hordeum vulgare]|nr:hypothetical protein D1007_55786 [Hordeum vulgare]